ncbi:hypothetical protein K466DRAFT_192472 [Polyporus arcularius HHB13444]|uniref:Uncharacterized protein n=1 Tax=Polyporus arcularius HHB13444 TaxID=1314778 RepID=A0A5C3PYF0_9APHY|nr:hypothetical protein K466DRAFT_192472 [Polyporus arcularius HHB13444]
MGKHAGCCNPSSEAPSPTRARRRAPSKALVPCSGDGYGKASRNDKPPLPAPASGDGRRCTQISAPDACAAQKRMLRICEAAHRLVGKATSQYVALSSRVQLGLGLGCPGSTAEPARAPHFNGLARAAEADGELSEGLGSLGDDIHAAASVQHVLGW